MGEANRTIKADLNSGTLAAGAYAGQPRMRYRNAPFIRAQHTSEQLAGSRGFAFSHMQWTTDDAFDREE